MDHPPKLAALLAPILCAAVVGCTDLEADPCDFYVCEVGDADCVASIADALACQRDVDRLVPEIRVISRAQAVAELEGEPLPTEELQRRRDYYRAESLVGLMPENYDPQDFTSDLLEDVVAYYRRDTRDVTLIEDSGIEDPQLRYEILVHEMVHVYQDATWDLAFQDAASAQTFDRFMALRAVVEGDAELYRSLAAVRALGYMPEDIDWDRTLFDAKEDAKRRAFETEAPSIDAVSHFAYVYGLSFIRRAWNMGGFPYVESTVRYPPDAVREIMRIEQVGTSGPIATDYSNEDAALEPEAVPIVEGYTYLGGDFQGTWLLNAMLQRTASTTYHYEDRLHSVTADHLSGWRNDETGDVAIVWRIRSAAPLTDLLLAPGSHWRSSASNAELAPQYLHHRVGEDEVLIASTSDASAVLGALRGWQSPRVARTEAGLDGSVEPSRPAPKAWTCALHNVGGVAR